MYICLNRGTAGGGLGLKEFVDLAADAGFAGADVDPGYGVEKGAAALRDLYAARGLRFGGWGPPVDWRGDLAKHAEGLGALRNYARVARELGIDSCATWIMPSSDLPFLENWQLHVSRLREVASVLAGHGLRLGLEFVAPYHLRRKFAHEFIFTPGLMLELAGEAGPNVGLLVDVFHCHCAGDTWEFIAKIPADKIVLAHLNDAPNLPVAQIEDGNRLLPGEGGIDVDGFMRALATAGYDGPVSLEVFSAALRALPPEQAAQKAAAACRRFG